MAHAATHVPPFAVCRLPFAIYRFNLPFLANTQREREREQGEEEGERSRKSSQMARGRGGCAVCNSSCKLLPMILAESVTLNWEIIPGTIA